MTPTPTEKLTFLHTRHPIYDANVNLWLQNERRMRGGVDVLEELTRFEWENPRGDHFLARQQQAVYLNFPDRFASIMVGHMMRQAPVPGNSLSFGTLGPVRRSRDSNKPTRAELLYYNTNGVGADGSQWNNWWTMVAKAAVGTGHRWVLCEGPETPPATFAGEINGLRPFLSHYSPISVINWEYENGRLAMAVIKRMRRKISRETPESGNLLGNNYVRETLLLTRSGWAGFGPEFVDGGWFLFDEEDFIDKQGTWSRTRGEIPMFPLYYERVEADAQPDQPPTESRKQVTIAMSRSGVTEMGNASVAYMNLASAADFDAFDGASSVQALVGVDEAGFNLFVSKVKQGSRYAPLKSNEDTQKQPSIIDASAGVVLADVFDRRLSAKRQEAIELMLNEIETAPYASGESKKVSFTDGKAPRLAVFATEIETAQNAAIYFLEQMWTGAMPQGGVTWPTQFDLVDMMQAVLDYFEVEQVAGVTSPTIAAKAMAMAARKLGLVNNDEEQAAAEAEYLTSAQKKADALNAPAPAPTPGFPPKQAAG